MMGTTTPSDASAQSPSIFVTGAAGFVGSHVVSQALEKGWNVVCTVRDLAQREDVYTAVTSKASPGVSLKLVEMDLLSASQEAFVAAMKGCTFVAHIASPFIKNNLKAAETQAVIDGTARVLRACAQTPTVAKVVLTSSVSAIGEVRAKKTDGKGTTSQNKFTDEEWQDNASKAAIEKAAWELADELGLDLSTVNPSYMQGPVLHSKSKRNSCELGKKLLTGEVSAIKDVGMNVCSVEDVAATHLAALCNEDASILFSGFKWPSDGPAAPQRRRYIVASGNIKIADFADAAREQFPNIKTNKAAKLSTWGAWITSFVDGNTQEFRCKTEAHYDRAQTEKLLGRRLSLPMDACLQMTQSLVDLGVVASE